MFFIQLTDLHLRAPAADLGEDYHAKFVSNCLRKLADAYPDADVCVITGDLTDQGEQGAYQWLKGQLNDLPFPTIPLVGNHDDRNVFLETFGTHVVEDHGFVQGEFHTDDAVLIFLDTLKPGSDAGTLCNTRLRWLDESLQANRNKSVTIFMHHPPCKIGDPDKDQIRLDNAHAFGSVLGNPSNVGHIFCGHVHRNFSTIWNKIPVSCLDAPRVCDDGKPVEFCMDAVVGTIENGALRYAPISLTQGVDGVVSLQQQVAKPSA